MARSFQKFDPFLSNILDQTTLQWVFFGGKGGVGKTTCSLGLAIRLSKVRESVLIISTDRAHSLSDALGGQQFSKEPTLVNDFNNLYAMEMDSTIGVMRMPDDHVDETDPLRMGRKMMHEIVGEFPGINEAMSYAKVMKLIKNMNFSVIVFDTADTGHALQFVTFPKVVAKGLEELLKLKMQHKPLFERLLYLLALKDNTADEMSSKIEDLHLFFRRIDNLLCNPYQTTFVCVCIAEFLSLRETERLVRELYIHGIDTRNIIVNQLIYPKLAGCNECKSRHRFQHQYFNEIVNSYKDFHVTELPLLQHEIRGVTELTQFFENFATPR